jgi:hypothetical protein
MSDRESYGFEEADAKRLSEDLERCLAIMDAALALVESKYDPQTVLRFKKDIGKVTSPLYINVLQLGIYGQYPQFQHEPPDLEKLGMFVASPEAELDLKSVPIIDLLVEALHDGASGFLPGLVAHEPIDVAAIDVELSRRSGCVAGEKSGKDWVSWYLASGKLTDGENDVLTMMSSQKAVSDEILSRRRQRDKRN